MFIKMEENKDDIYLVIVKNKKTGLKMTAEEISLKDACIRIIKFINGFILDEDVEGICNEDYDFEKYVSTTWKYDNGPCGNPPKLIYTGDVFDYSEGMDNLYVQILCKVFDHYEYTIEHKDQIIKY